MKISKVITELEKIKQSKGDIDVVVWPYDGQTTTFTVKSIYVLKDNEIIFDHSED